MGVMLDCTLSTEQLAELRVGHRRTRDKREADRIKAVVFLATGWSVEEVAEVLLVDIILRGLVAWCEKKCI